MNDPIAWKLLIHLAKRCRDEARWRRLWADTKYADNAYSSWLESWNTYQASKQIYFDMQGNGNVLREILLNLARRCRLSARCRRRSKGTVFYDLKRSHFIESWNALQTAKHLLNEELNESTRSSTTGA